jgi:hypothetical protein
MNFKLKADGDYVYQTGDQGKVVRVRVHYIKSASLSRRGIFVSIEPWEIQNGYESFALCSDASVFVERLARVKPSSLALIGEPPGRARAGVGRDHGT